MVQPIDIQHVNFFRAVKRDPCIHHRHTNSKAASSHPKGLFTYWENLPNTRLSIKILYAFLVFPMRTTCPDKLCLPDEMIRSHIYKNKQVRKWTHSVTIMARLLCYCLKDFQIVNANFWDYSKNLCKKLQHKTLSQSTSSRVRPLWDETIKNGFNYLENGKTNRESVFVIKCMSHVSQQLQLKKKIRSDKIDKSKIFFI